ncbi:MAG TPA: thioester dehydrase, partial [Gammaproteobacteria bacterium]|nr:thioester dehydrase [Gammaproteobacteria bacterium]
GQLQDAAGSVLRLRVEASSPWFEGHFPQFAILPGVVQIGWAEHYACALYGHAPGLCAVEQVKFKRPILPGTELDLVLKPDAATGKLRYEYRDAETSYSAGTLRFRGTP